MTRSSFQVSHTERATDARQQPGRWTNVRSYADFQVAETVARKIRAGAIAAYQPPGAYQARVTSGPHLWPYRPFTVHCRYRGVEAA